MNRSYCGTGRHQASSRMLPSVSLRDTVVSKVNSSSHVPSLRGGSGHLGWNRHRSRGTLADSIMESKQRRGEDQHRTKNSGTHSKAFSTSTLTAPKGGLGTHIRGLVLFREHRHATLQVGIACTCTYARAHVSARERLNAVERRRSKWPALGPTCNARWRPCCSSCLSRCEHAGFQ